jgi:hypothetical protein
MCTCQDCKHYNTISDGAWECNYLTPPWVIDSPMFHQRNVTMAEECPCFERS